jgi:hypothetical protein
MVIKSGDTVEVFISNMYQGRGIVVESNKDEGLIVETFDNIRYSCSEDELEIVE